MPPRFGARRRPFAGGEECSQAYAKPRKLSCFSPRVKTEAMNRTFLWGASILVGGVAACNNAGGSGTNAKPEVEETQIKLDLPAPPEFNEPKPYPDGSHSVSEMRLKSQKLLDQPVKVTGYVVFKYDFETCAIDVGEKLVKADPKLCEGKKDVIECTKRLGQKDVGENPDKCGRPYFYLADAPNASFEKSLWVVEVPRPLLDYEKRDPALVEAFKKAPPPPQVTVGQKLTVSGTWAIKSPQGFGNSDGLLVYAGSAPAT